MWRTHHRLTAGWILLAAVSMTACTSTVTSSRPSQSPLNGSPRPTCCTPAASGTPAPTGGPAHIVAGVVSLDGSDTGETLAVPTGTRVDVALAGTTDEPLYAWSDVSSSDDSVLASQGATNHASGGASATFVAASAGRSTLSAESDPDCLRTVPSCALPSALWTVTIVVG